MMDRRYFTVVVAASLLPAPALQAQQARRTYRIGILSPEIPPPGLLEEFRRGLGELGYVEGQNAKVELRNAGGENERLASLANDLVRLDVDVILAVNTPAAEAAKKATRTIPIVITRVADPVKTGLVASLSKPGGNVTGLSFMPDELSAKRLQLLKEAVPGLSRVAALWDARNAGATIVVRQLEPASSRLGLQLMHVAVQAPREFATAVQTASQAGVGAIVVVDDAFVTKYRIEIVDLAAKHRLPVVALFKPFAEAGALLAYGPSTPAMYRRAAHYVDRILKGAKPQDLPIEQPTTFELVINLKAARTLGVELPATLVGRADEVIE
jgi:putative tryptophan/tyrosine transport system substrate-binding protein